MRQLFVLVKRGIIIFTIISLVGFIWSIDTEWVWESIKWITIGLLIMLIVLILSIRYLDKKDKRGDWKMIFFEKFANIIDSSSILWRIVILFILIVLSYVMLYLLINIIYVIDIMTIDSVPIMYILVAVSFIVLLFINFLLVFYLCILLVKMVFALLESLGFLRIATRKCPSYYQPYNTLKEIKLRKAKKFFRKRLFPLKIPGYKIKKRNKN